MRTTSDTQLHVSERQVASPPVEEDRVDRIGSWLLQHPGFISAALVLALLMLPLAVWLDMKNLSNATLTRQVSDINSMISNIRSYYSQNVVGRVIDNEGNTTLSHNYQDIPGGIPIPATLSIELGNVIGSRDEDIRYRFVSDRVFKNRASHNLDAFETEALQKFRQSGLPSDQHTEISGSLFDRRIRMAVPVVMGQSCVTCHNSHAESPKKNWKVGDIRGIQSLYLAQPIALNIFSFKYLLLYLLTAGAFGGLFAMLEWRQAKHFSRINMDLEETNSFLAAISIKISKYLSPQVYKSIFSGERDAVISTERKKLTIFFSDIADFSATAERLQPEQLTDVLNEYFSEMAAIAEKHGATIDKFIGDAILCFFGDPESRGDRNDALACLEMSIAMQSKMAELNTNWRSQGIETPFKARIGINTGYCNVGNFGSEDRMDYTIIGAEANLAARLQSISPPGGIVMSYETYALVQDRVKARELDSVQLKGISRSTVPYLIEGYHSELSREVNNFVERKTSHMQLQLDLTNVAPDEAVEIEEALSSALEQVKKLPPGVTR